MVRKIDIEVALAAEGEQRLVALKLDEGTSVAEGYRQGLAAMFSCSQEQQWREAPLGIFGQKVRDPDTAELKHGDRIEAYAPLKIDPKQARRARANNKSGAR
ncbi:RnfH family protein [Carnimonas bestiolae]|uniref:RnfH family protein n=1 Tax=Carnimonas bestiolae TaxID=3402172 RepID=UPI003EDBAAC7